MEVIIKFTQQDGEEDYLTALHGWKYKSILIDVISLLRSHDKGWDDSEFTTDTVRDFIMSKLDENGVSL